MNAGHRILVLTALRLLMYLFIPVIVFFIGSTLFPVFIMMQIVVVGLFAYFRSRKPRGPEAEDNLDRRT